MPKHSSSSSVPSRLRAAKAPKTGSKGHFKPSVQARRRTAFYSKGKGSVGLLIRMSRLIRTIRKIRKDQTARTNRLMGIEAPPEQPVEAGKKAKGAVLYKGFSTTLGGALDAYANRVMELAAEHARGRKNPGNAKTGLKVKPSDIEFAVRWIGRIANE